jgi:SET domain-containing protein
MPPDDRPFEIRPSPMHGMGAFATRRIPEGTRLIEYAGERLTPDEADARYPDEAGKPHHTELFAIDDDIVIDAAVDGNDARFINHSCDPNCDAIVEHKRSWRTTTPSCWRSGIRRRRSAGTRARVVPRRVAGRFWRKNGRQCHPEE